MTAVTLKHVFKNSNFFCLTSLEVSIEWLAYSYMWVVYRAIFVGDILNYAEDILKLLYYIFLLQQNLEIHRKMGMTDEQLEAYERQEREVCISAMFVFEIKPSAVTD